MWRNFAILLAVAFAAISCSHNVSRIQTHALPSPNPTTYTFALALEEVHTKALKAFSTEHQWKEPVFRKPSGSDFSRLTAECSTNAVSGKALFDDPANAHHIYLHSFHTPFTASPVYHGRKGGLPYMATFHLHLASSGSHTVATVKASNAEVLNGTKFGIGSCGPGQHWNCVSVKPTTVEEYSILRYLGSYMGVTNMPPVILPAQ
jgi:hypothetical protein